eukprot:4242899-Alexandrium_andersonii.AAC.1
MVRAPKCQTTQSSSEQDVDSKRHLVRKALRRIPKSPYMCNPGPMAALLHLHVGFRDSGSRVDGQAIGIALDLPQHYH